MLLRGSNLVVKLPKDVCSFIRAEKAAMDVSQGAYVANLFLEIADDPAAGMAGILKRRYDHNLLDQVGAEVLTLYFGADTLEKFEVAVSRLGLSKSKSLVIKLLVEDARLRKSLGMRKAA
jgi:hypothetical protein